MSKRIAIVGGGAAGFFAAINIKSKNPEYKVTILEQSNKLLSKVKISGGGRCNVTHACFEPKKLSKHYPRGERFLLPLFQRFQPKDTITWFEERGIALKVEDDNRMFPSTDDSQTIIDCFIGECKKLKIPIKQHFRVSQFINENDTWKTLNTAGDSFEADAVLIATGAVPAMWRVIESIGHTIITPVPSLFTFNIKDNRINDLPGSVFKHVQCKIAGTKITSEGPLLITHWGLSAPAILKLSAFAARELADRQYKFDILVNLCGRLNQEEVRAGFVDIIQEHPKKKLSSVSPFDIPKRYWHNLLRILEFKEDNTWSDIGKKQLNKLVEQLSNAQFSVDGKSTFKDEFVTAGGVSLDEINKNTMESKLHPGLYFAGEVTDIDAITGGFNFQAAWTTAWVVSESV